MVDDGDVEWKVWYRRSSFRVDLGYHEVIAVQAEFSRVLGSTFDSGKTSELPASLRAIRREIRRGGLSQYAASR